MTSCWQLKQKSNSCCLASGDDTDTPRGALAQRMLAIPARLTTVSCLLPPNFTRRLHHRRINVIVSCRLHGTEAGKITRPDDDRRET